MGHRPWCILVIAGSMLIAACGSPESDVRDTTEPPVGVSQDLDASSLTELLVAAGATVEPAGAFVGDPFSGTSRVISVNGVDVHLYEYRDSAGAATEAAYIAPDAATITVGDQRSYPEWHSTPHFYLAGRLIVQYIGNDATITGLLESLLGPQFAGGRVDYQPRLVVAHGDPAEGAPLSFEEAALRAESVVLGEVTAVDVGPRYVASVEPPACIPSQLVTVQFLEVYKGSLVAGATAALYQNAGQTDVASGCGEDASAEEVVMIFEGDPLYEVNQRYLLALGLLVDSLDPDPAIATANGELIRLTEELDLRHVLPHGRLLVEQGGHFLLPDADVYHLAHDTYGRTIAGEAVGASLAEYEAHLADVLR